MQPKTLSEKPEFLEKLTMTNKEFAKQLEIRTRHKEVN
jgi:hypothetical protein